MQKYTNYKWFIYIRRTTTSLLEWYRESNTACTTNKKEIPKTIWWMSKKRMHISHVLRRIKMRYFNSYLIILWNLDNNSAFYYNQILMSVASLSRKKYGVHKKIVYVNAASLKEAKCKLKLSLKTSNTSYRHYKKISIQKTTKVRILTDDMVLCFKYFIRLSQSKNNRTDSS